MNTRKNTKRALLTSCVSMLLCVSMLIGSTFAWFTDTATVSVNKIEAGNLDVQIIDENGDEKTTALSFKNVNNETDILWEPGATFHTEKFAIKNKGNLALKFKVEINNTEVSYNKLNEVINFSLVTPSEDGSETVVALADMQDVALEAGGQTGLYYLKGKMAETADNQYMGLTMEGVAITVYAAQYTSESDSIDNQYDKDATYGGPVSTVDGTDAFVKAFQELEEGGTITLTGDVDMTGKAWNPVMNKGFTLDGNGYTIKGMNGPLVGTTAAKEYTIKNVTFKNLNANGVYGGIAIGGVIAYADTCSYINMENVTINNANISDAEYVGGFVGYTSGYGVDTNGPVNASHNFTNCTITNSTLTSITDGSVGGLIGHAGSNAATTTRINGFSYKGLELKQTNANRPEKTGNMIGTANVGIVYITDADINVTYDIGRFVPGTTGKLVINGEEKTEFANNNDDEVVVKDTIVEVEGANDAERQESLNDAINKAASTGATVVELPEGKYTLPSVSNKDITISGTEDTVIDTTTSMPSTTGADLTFEGVTVKFKSNGSYATQGFTHSNSVTYKNCVIEGQQFLYAPNNTFIGCTFENSGDNYNVWTYGTNATFTDCTFNCDGKAVLIYTEAAVTASYTFNNCTFNDSDKDPTVKGKAAIEVAESANGKQANYTVNINNCTVNGFDKTTENAATFGGTDLGTAVWGNKNLIPADRLHIIIDGKDVY